MPVIAVYETFNARGAEEDDSFQTQYERSFDVLCNSLLDAPDTILAAVDPNTGLVIPAHDSLWLPNPLVPRVAQCRSRAARQTVENPFQWAVTLRYSTQWQQRDPDPTHWPARVRGETVTHREAAGQGYAIDVTGGTVSGSLSDIVNSASDPFDPPPEKDASRVRYTIERYELDSPDDTAAQFLDTVNDASWRKWDVGCAKYSGYSFEFPEYFNGVAYYKVTHTVDCRKAPAQLLLLLSEGWAITALDCGFREIGPDGKLREIRDQRANQLSSPALLNGHGKSFLTLGTANPPPIFLAWRGYELSGFTYTLDLPES